MVSIQEAKQQVQIAVEIGKKKGIELAIDRYDKYRKLMYWVLFASLIPWALMKKWDLLFITFMIWHLHTLSNQLWWKLVNFEHYYIKEKENEKTE